MPPHRAHWTHLAHPDNFSKKNTRRRHDINGQHGKPQPLLPGHVQVIERRVTFDGWEECEPDGKEEFKPDSKCSPDRDGLGWQIDRDGTMRPRNIYPANGRRPTVDSFIGPCDARTTQSAHGGPSWSDGSNSIYDEEPRPDRGHPGLHHHHPNHHNLPHPRRTPLPPNEHYESMGGASCPPSCFPPRKRTTKGPETTTLLASTRGKSRGTPAR